MATSKDECEELSFKLGTVFKPTTPVNREDLFAGRQSQIRDVVDAINQAGQHAVLFGERGVGKTSLANMIFPKLYCPGFTKMAPLINCMTTDRYADVWKRIFEEILFIAVHSSPAIDLLKEARKLLQEYTGAFADQISPDIVRRVLHLLSQDVFLVVIIDEFDTMADPDTRSTMADTLKFLSDRNVRATIVLIGVADDVQELIENHRSVERCLSQIRMPRMSRDELELIVAKGLSSVGMRIERPALHEISRLSIGLPHYAHLLGLEAGRSALDEGQTTVGEKHVGKAVKTAINKAQASIQGDYTEATTSARRDALYRQVLLGCALAVGDDLGYFYPKDVRAPLSRILGKDYKVEAFVKHLHTFCEEKRGPVLRKDERTGRSRFRFVNPLMQPYVMIRGLADGHITETDLKETRDPNDPQKRLF